MYYAVTSYGRDIAFSKSAVKAGRVAMRLAERGLSSATLWKVDDFGVRTQVITYRY